MASSKFIVTLMILTLVSLVGAGCSDDSSPVATTAIDTAPPGVPANVGVAYASGTATISWDPNTVDSDLAGFIVIREKNGQQDALLSSPAMITSFQDSSPLLGASSYHVFSVDQAGNESAVTSVDLMIQFAHNDRELANQ